MTLHLVTLAYSARDFRHCAAIRAQVFMQEQQVPAHLEWDAADAAALHLLAWQDAQPVACARLLADGHLGRMAVLPAWRGKGIGSAMLQMALQHFKQQGLPAVALSAQTHAISFYQRHGFVVVSAPYLDAGLLHVDMRCELL